MKVYQLMINTYSPLGNPYVATLMDGISSLTDDVKWHYDLDFSYFFGAADVVLLQRKKILNSGNLPLAFLMGKVCNNLLYNSSK